MSEWLLQGIGLTKSYQEGSVKADVLKGIDFSLRPAEMVAIVGSSGSGKSTLLHLFGVLDQPSSGQVLFEGKDVFTLNTRQQAAFRNQKLGFIYQFHHLLGEFSAQENVAMPLMISGQSFAEAKRSASRMLERVGLGKRLAHRPAELSGGERQRVAIARALINQPQLVLADEPTGNLDHQSAEAVYSLMCELNREMGTAFVMVTHDRELAAQLDRSETLCDGKLESQR
ncbi:lipoprotein-releasing ABC transporter ATP-binding protein LolD [Dongshaea marina]|uniref:lipoprotein-releasing ABC transporter ATP-binding protein LolD n=1 Tax=Dongshaea marina TaxID=2047966 RepID=UPI000D3EA101|nr:lipoprotein-releasing ABC transporter ATP-binding protein LolD [Dongshaea marina]